MEDHVVILGWDGFSERILRELNRSGIPVAVATEGSVAPIREKYGNLDDVQAVRLESFEALGRLEEIDAADAARFFVNVESDDDKLLRVVDLAEHDEWNGEIDVVLENEQLRETFQDAGVRYAVSRREVSSKLLATHIYEPHVARVVQELLTSTETGAVDQSVRSGDSRGSGERDLGIQQIRIGPEFEPESLEQTEEGGWQFGDLVNVLRRRFGAIPLAITEGTETERLPDTDRTVSSGDCLLVAVARDVEQRVRKFLDADNRELLS